MIEDIPSVDIVVKEESLSQDIFRIYQRLFPDVTDPSQLQFEQLSGGYVNNITKVSLKNWPDKAFIFRTFEMNFRSVSKKAKKNENSPAENGASIAVDLAEIISGQHNLQLEYAVINEVSKHGLCKPVIAKYANGLCYTYTPGNTLNSAQMLTEDFLEEAAFKFARFHSIKLELPGEFKVHYDRLFKKVFPPIQAMLEKMDKHVALINEWPYTELPRVRLLLDEMERGRSICEALGLGRIVFAHNDCNQTNLIWNPDEGLSFIDFEVTMNNYAWWDLGYFLGCFPGSFLYDFDRTMFPSADQRLRFLSNYLKHFHQLNNVRSEEAEFAAELETLFHQANLSVLMFLGRMVMVGPMFDQNPEMFKNEDHREARANDKHFCGKYSLQVYKLYAELRDPFLSEAEEHLKRKKCNT